MCLAPDTPNQGIGCDNMTCIIVKPKHQQKRLRTEGNEDYLFDEDGDFKKPKLDIIESIYSA